MNEIKIYLDFPPALAQEFNKEGRTIEQALKDAGNKIQKKEISITGEQPKRGIFLTILITAGTVGTWLGLEFAKEVVKPIIKDLAEPVTIKLRDILSPIYKKLGITKYEQAKEKIEIFEIQSSNKLNEKKLIPVELPKSEDEKVEVKSDLLVRVKE